VRDHWDLSGPDREIHPPGLGGTAKPRHRDRDLLSADRGWQGSAPGCGAEDPPADAVGVPGTHPADMESGEHRYQTVLALAGAFTEHCQRPISHTARLHPGKPAISAAGDDPSPC